MKTGTSISARFSLSTISLKINLLIRIASRRCNIIKFLIKNLVLPLDGLNKLCDKSIRLLKLLENLVCHLICHILFLLSFQTLNYKLSL